MPKLLLRNKLTLGLVVVILVFLAAYIYTAYYNKEKLSFVKWYNKHSSKKEKATNDRNYPIHVFEYTSPDLLIDSIYKSMQGPFNVQYVNLDIKSQSKWDNLFKKTEVYWLVGYSVQVVDSAGNLLSDDFLCHNNLDIYDKTTAPWQINSVAKFCRLFTLTAGQTSIQLPKGYGVPIASWQDLTVTSQALNHNVKNIRLKTKQRVKIYYVKDSEIDFAMKPLYQQAVFVTKQLSGPAGEFAKPPINFNPSNPIKIDSNTSVSYSVCCTGRVFDENFNAFKDNYNRTYTGHWDIAPGYEKLTSNITLLLDLKYNTKIYFIGTHAHPFSETIELIDKTANKSLFKAVNKSYSDKIGLSYLGSYSDTSGIPVFKNNEYLLVSEYNNTQSVTYTAMATMFVYLEER